MIFDIGKKFTENMFLVLLSLAMIIYPPLNFLETIVITAISSDFETNQALSRGYYDDDAYLRGEEEGIPAIAYLFLWVAVCASVAFLYRLADKFNMRNEEETKIIFQSIVAASGMGGAIGFAITLGVIIVTLIIDALFNSDLFSFVTEKTNLFVLFFAAVNVAGMNYLLRENDDVIILTKDIVLSDRNIEEHPDIPNSNEEKKSDFVKKRVIQCKGCKNKLRIPASKKGKVTCPKCSSSWTI